MDFSVVSRTVCLPSRRRWAAWMRRPRRPPSEAAPRTSVAPAGPALW